MGLVSVGLSRVPYLAVSYKPDKLLHTLTTTSILLYSYTTVTCNRTITKKINQIKFTQTFFLLWVALQLPVGFHHIFAIPLVFFTDYAFATCTHGSHIIPQSNYLPLLFTIFLLWVAPRLSMGLYHLFVVFVGSLPFATCTLVSRTVLQ